MSAWTVPTSSGRRIGYEIVFVNPDFVEWIDGIGQWWVYVYEWSWRRRDFAYGPFPTQLAATTQMSEFLAPLPMSPCASANRPGSSDGSPGDSDS